jgi:hypothetical protein
VPSPAKVEANTDSTGLAHSFPRGPMGEAMRQYKTGFHGGTRGFHPPVCTHPGITFGTGADHIKEHDEENVFYPTTLEAGPEKDMWTVSLAQELCLLDSKPDTSK